MSKEEIRMQIWHVMEEQNIASFPRPVYNRIPNFVGSEKAAQNLRGLEEYKSASVIFCNPDSPQRYVRQLVLLDRKTLVIATPKLRQGFLLINPNILSSSQVHEASTIHGAFKSGQQARLNEVKIDMFIAGSVAVSVNGERLGKGTGYSDREYALLKNAGSLSPKALVMTTVHDVQVVENIPKQEWDIPVDIIVTPTRAIRVRRQRSLSKHACPEDF